MGVQFVEMSIDEVCEKIKNMSDRKLTARILNTFIDNGLTYKVKEAYGCHEDINRDMYRIYCYVKKSKETMIINTKGYAGIEHGGEFVIQLRITNPMILENIGLYTKNIRSIFLNGRDCMLPNCYDCKKWYRFHYNDKNYQKCGMLCSNFNFLNLSENDHDDLVSIVNEEIRFCKPKRKTKA